MAPRVLTVQDRAQIVELYFTSARSTTEVQRKWRTLHGIHAISPSHSTILRLVRNFGQHGSVADRPRRLSTHEEPFFKKKLKEKEM